eukprot:jgi/Orpsp1_1/1191718/evm.model.d7180000088037.1
MDHKHQRTSLRLEGKGERRLSPLNPLAAITNNSNTSSQKNEENTYIQSQLRKSTINKPDEIEIASTSSVSTTTPTSANNNNNHSNSTNITPTTPTSSSSTNNNIRNVTEEGIVKRKSITGKTPSLRRLSRCLSEANEVTMSNNEDLSFSVSSAALIQTSTSVRPIPIPNPLPLRRISRCSISLENDENIINPSISNTTASIKSNVTNTSFNNQPPNSNSYHSVIPNNNINTTSTATTTTTTTTNNNSNSNNNSVNPNATA